MLNNAFKITKNIFDHFFPKKNTEETKNILRRLAYDDFRQAIRKPVVQIDEVLNLTRAFAQDPEIAVYYDKYMEIWLAENSYSRGAEGFGSILFNETPEDALYFLEVFDAGQDAKRRAMKSNTPEYEIKYLIGMAKKDKLLTDGRPDLIRRFCPF